jgi:glutamate 5-kinase
VQKKKRKARQDDRESEQEIRGRSQPSTPVVLAMSSSILSEASHSLSTPEQSRPPSPSHGAARSEHDVEEDEGEEGEEEQIEFGRGLANYNYQEIDKIKGHKSSEIEKILGYIEAEHCVECITSLKRLDL